MGFPYFNISFSPLPKNKKKTFPSLTSSDLLLHFLLSRSRRAFSSSSFSFTCPSQNIRQRCCSQSFRRPPSLAFGMFRRWVLGASLAIAIVSSQRARRGSHHTQFPTFGRWTRTVWVTAVYDIGFRSVPSSLHSIFPSFAFMDCVWNLFICWLVLAF
jgi:hypothetical protein